MDAYFSPHQLYRGFEEEDIALLQRYSTHPAEILENWFIDGFGQKTSFEVVPFISPEALNVERLKLPLPDDGLHAEALEYVALVDAVDRAAGSFCAVELGAGWGPWLALAGVLCRDKGLRPVTLVGVEGLPSRFALLRKHLALNGLLDEEKVPGQAGEVRLFQGAVAVDEKELFFPDAPVTDMGTAAAASADEKDYRGASHKMIKVATYTLPTILDGLERVDFMHFDVQGAEFDLVAANLPLLRQRVGSLMIATHSRVIEGRLIDLLLGEGWELAREKPCRVNWQAHAPALEGKTVVDGCQYWINGNLRQNQAVIPAVRKSIRSGAGKVLRTIKKLLTPSP
jgi:FkbM family methyltransferase